MTISDAISRINRLTNSSARAEDADDALKFSQAARNVADTLLTVHAVETHEEGNTERELRAALGQLLEQVYQMQGMFDDEDGAIARAIEDAEDALEASSA